MKSKIVLWGENASNEKVLIGIELKEKDNKVMIYTFSQEVATEAFYQSLLDKWREGDEIEFPDHKVIERPLSISESLLPDDIKVERTDIISRAQAEWHFVVLSSKLYEMYKGELDDLKEKIDKLSDYDDILWNDAKNFWAKVQDQVREHNLFKDHGNILKERTNNLFSKLKDLKSSLQKEFEIKSKDVAEAFYSELKDVESKLEKGLGLKPIFEDLKAIQDKYYKAELTKEDRKSVWDKLDATFKAVKDRKFGEPKREGDFGGASRLQNRYDGLIDAIKKMESSINKDKQEKEFQDKKVQDSGGQLEMQIRQAKIKMIEERISSKTEKLNDMYKTRTELDSKLASEKKKMEQRAKDAKKEEVKETIKQKIASDIQNEAEKREELTDKLTHAAEDIKEMKKGKKKDSILGAISETLSESFEDMVDTVKAVAEVVEDKLEDVADKVEDKLEVAGEIISEKYEEVADKIEEKIDEIKSKVDSDKKPEESSEA